MGEGEEFSTGTTGQFAFGSYRSTVNSPSPILNPYTQGFLDFFISQNLLQGFGLAVNNRYIRVARNNMKVNELQVKRQLITTISAALNLYWDLVSFNEDVRIKEQALATAQKLYEDNKKQVAIGTLSAIEITRAAAEVSSVKENLLIAKPNVAQQETVLKNALSRNGVASPWMDDVHIVTLDRIQVPEKEELKPMPELVQQALAGRPELQQTRINLESTLINLKGSRNALLPTLQAFADFVNNAAITLQQARARYDTAAATRVLAQQTLDAEQKKFQLGTSSTPLVVQAQRDLNNDQSAEIQSMANYPHAKVAFDDAMGGTLEENGISMEEAKSGQVARQSSIPDLARNPKK